MTDFLDVIRERGSGALDKKMGIEIIEASPNRLVGTMPVEGNTQPIGLLHGGANVVLAESLGSIGTQLHAGPNRRIVGVDINATHHKSATSGVVTAIATAVVPGHHSIHDSGVSYVVTPITWLPSRPDAARAMFPPNEWPIRIALLSPLRACRSSTWSATVNGPACGHDLP